MLELFQLDFMRRALGAGIVIAIIAPTIGLFLVVRRYSLMADTLAHVSLVGVAIGSITHTQPLLSAVAATLIASVGIDRLRKSRKLFGESVLALFLSGSLAVSTVLLSAGKGLNAGILGALFGSITTVSPSDERVIVILGIVVIAFMVWFYHALFTVSFDEEIARSSGMPVGWLNTVLVLMAALTVAVSLRVVGALLIGALMVIPVLAALQWGKSFRKSLILAVAVSLLSVVSGLFLSYALDLASGGTIVLVSLGAFLFSLFMNRR